MPDPDTDASWVTTTHGRLHAKRWEPAAEQAGERAPIVLFHDSLGCVALWRDFPERLAAATGRPVIAYDRLGFGRSDPHPGRLAPDFVRTEAHEGFQRLREALRIGDFIAFGHSVGGGMAVACAAAHADQCRGLITESAQAFVEDRTIQGILDARHAFTQPEQRERLRRYHGDKADWVLEAWIGTWLDPAFAGWNLDDELRRVRCTALVIHGDQDEYGSVRHPRRIAELAGGPAVVRILPGCGHVPHRQETETVLDSIGQWLPRPYGATAST